MQVPFAFLLKRIAGAIGAVHCVLEPGREQELWTTHYVIPMYSADEQPLCARIGDIAANAKFEGSWTEPPAEQSQLAEHQYLPILVRDVTEPVLKPLKGQLTGPHAVL